MMEKKVFICHTPFIRDNAIRVIQAISFDGKPTVVEIKPLTRNLDQSARFHAICGDVAKQAEYLHRKLTLQQWKVLFISGHAIAIGDGADMVPGLCGEFINLRESSAQMTVGRMASLIEFCQAYCVDNNIRLSA